MRSSFKQFIDWYWPSALLFTLLAFIFLLVGWFGEIREQGDFWSMPVYLEKGLIVFLIGNFIAAMWASTKVNSSSKE